MINLPCVIMHVASPSLTGSFNDEGDLICMVILFITALASRMQIKFCLFQKCFIGLDNLSKNVLRKILFLIFAYTF